MRTFLVLLTVMLTVLGTPGQSQSNSDVLKSLKTAHPRLLLLQGEEQEILSQVKKHPEWNAVHQEILAECDKLLDTQPVERIKIGKRLLDKSRECLRRVFQLSYAYRTTKDEKYLRRAEKEMLAVAAFEDWNPTHFLDVAEMTMAVAIGYDWLYDGLSEESRGKIRNAIIKKGIEPSLEKRYSSFLNAEHNWNQVCNAGISFGALAIAESEPELAAKMISRAITSIPKAMVPSYQPDGAYPEGFSYWGYGTSFNVLFISAIEKALDTDFGLSKSPGFLKTAGFLQNLVGPTGLAHNWGDSGLKEGLSPAMFWYAEKTGDASLLWTQKKLLSDKTGNNIRNRILPALLVWGAKTDLDAVKPPAKKQWVGQGPSPVALMRTSWEDPNAIFVGLKTGSPAVNHAHMDVGSFVIDAQGERWAIDFGMQDYNSLETKGVDLWNRTQNSQRWEVFRLNNFAHNTLSFDGQLMNATGYAKIDSWSEGKSEMWAVTDLSDMYKGQVAAAKRGVAIRDARSVVIRDEVKTGDKPARMRWNLLTSADVKVVDDKTVELAQNGKKMLLVFDTKADIEIKTWPTTPTHDYDAPNPDTQFVGFEVSLPANSSASFNAFFTPTNKLPQVKPLASWK
ncbi:heparinase II/III domain-containing protein [Dyadobacter crusticola]|uniref:heparinase II/III domain-containing protein n=1 Tax=Dyadobacter crusticola TaxID=292407 RepID=UPI0004E1FF92|nr:heparinase II/III family protein [Dyadobacter crusticola]